MDFATRFDPKEAEERIYRLWEEGGWFRADPASPREPFTLVIPPPNVTGSLHMGHALNNTLQDILARRKRMEGYETLYLPGTDHAGIATQVVVERELAREKKTRWDLGREKFLERVWRWKEQYGNTILYQLRRLGCSCDWSRTRFTMDAGYTRAVRHVFVSLFKKGYIYRGLAIVNWCPRDLTALSDLEVVHKEEPGKLWHVRYPVEGEPGRFLVVATTRPETMLGDMAVAVHPDDARYRNLAGRRVLLPLAERPIPVIADAFVDPSFGSGAVKVTPAHDPNDFECARRHGIKALTVMDPKGVMNEAAGAYRGLDRFACRTRVVADLEARGLLEKVEDYAVPLGTCYRCGTVLEPYLSEQWFVSMKDLAAPALRAVRSGDVRFHPERWSKLYYDWMENIRDWCISRQIWWGHRIPVWYCGSGHATAAVEDPDRCAACGDRALRQDEDVLDTWFSSALWPFATLGWPEETPDLEKFYPTQVLVTARDIINLWVARMIMAGLEFRGEKPFSDVVIHASIMDDVGQRQSKSKGTGIDPLGLIDEYGADALRFALAWLCTGAQDIKFGSKLSVQRVEMSRNFVTKLWNAARYAASRIGDAPASPPEKDALEEDLWILSRLSATAAGVSDALDRYEFGEAAQLLYRFVWNDFCDWYIELSKRRAEEPAVRRTLAYVLDASLRLLHPFVPFVTEEIWQRLGALRGEARSALIGAPWPEVPASLRRPDIEERLELVFEAVRLVRDVRGRNGISPKTPVAAVLSTRDERTAGLLRAGASILRAQANVEALEIGAHQAKPRLSATAAAGDFTVYVPLEGKIDVAAERERARRELERGRSQAAELERQLANEEFRRRKPELAEEVGAKLEALQAKVRELEAHLRDLESA
jgi:valyl-tRNA synthetase